MAADLEEYVDIESMAAGAGKTLLEETFALIDDDNAPQSLTVVSSDRRLQAAARRRRASAVDCEGWLAELRARSRRRDDADAKPAEPSPYDVEAWKRYFGL